MHLALLIAWLLAAPVAQSDDTKPANLSRVSQSIVDQTNAFRADNNIGEVKTNQKLTKAATEFAEFLARPGKFSHDADGRSPSQRADAAGYAWQTVLENIAMEYSSKDFATAELTAKFITRWKDSPGHRKNMLNGDVTEIGVGVARSEDGHYYAVQMFGKAEVGK
jgi:uncharacterized protein YkwD